MRTLWANRVRIRARFIAASCLVVALGACTGPRGPAIDPATLPAPDTPPPAEYLQGDFTPPPTAADMPEASTRPRLLGFLFKRVPGDTTAREPVAAAPPPDASDPVPEVTTAAFDTEAPEGGGLFGFRGNTRADGMLPFGSVAKACDVSRRDMGKEVAASPGRGQYKLYDTDPSSIQPRTQYITGFRDGCARKFTASLALFGTAQVHEATRYNPLNTNPYSATDIAYEKVKTSVCRVARGVFCPDRAAKRMNREAVFLSVYREFGGTGTWMEMFLHRGQLDSYATLGGR